MCGWRGGECTVVGWTRVNWQDMGLVEWQGRGCVGGRARHACTYGFILNMVTTSTLGWWHATLPQRVSGATRFPLRVPRGFLHRPSPYSERGAACTYRGPPSSTAMTRGTNGERPNLNPDGLVPPSCHAEASARVAPPDLARITIHVCVRASPVGPYLEARPRVLVGRLQDADAELARLQICRCYPSVHRLRPRPLLRGPWQGRVLLARHRHPISSDEYSRWCSKGRNVLLLVDARRSPPSRKREWIEGRAEMRKEGRQQLPRA